MQRVKFVKNFKMYNEGEVAGFPVDEATTLLAIGAVEFIAPEPEVVEPEKPVKRKPGRPKRTRKPVTSFVLKD